MVKMATQSRDQYNLTKVKDTALSMANLANVYYYYYMKTHFLPTFRIICHENITCKEIVALSSEGV